MGAETTKWSSKMNELPAIFKNATASNIYTADTFASGGMLTAGATGSNLTISSPAAKWLRFGKHDFQPVEQEIEMAAPAPAVKNQMRVVKVYIADSDENLKLQERLLYTGDEKLTDFTDQELFFEVPMGELLSKHNAVRAKTVDKKASEKFGRDIFLEPVRIRDLKMVVVEVAVFD